MTHRSKPTLAIPALLVALVLLVYSPLIFTTYGVADDYVFLYRRMHYADFVFNQQTSGRPISFLLTNLAFALVDSIAGLSFIRFIGVLLSALLAWQYFYLLGMLQTLRPHRFWIALALVFLPTFQAILALAASYTFPLAACLGILAAIVLDAALENFRARWIWLALAPASLVVAFLIYQPTTMFYWLAAAILIFRKRRTAISLCARYAAYLALMGLTAGFVYVLVQATGGFLESRDTLVQDIQGKAVWFVGEALAHALGLFSIWPASTSSWLLVGVGLFIIAGLWLYFVGDWRSRLVACLVCVSLLPVAYLPSLVVAENWAGYRTIGGMASLSLLYLFMAVRGYARVTRNINWRATKRALIGVPIAVAVMAAALANYNIITYITTPQVIELGFLRSELVQLYEAGNPPTRITIVTPRWQEGGDQAAPSWIYDEFGAPSSYFAIGAEAITKLLLMDLKQNSDIELEFYGEPGLPHRDNPVINLRLIRYLGLRN